MHVKNLTETETLPLQLPVFVREHENKHVYTYYWWVYFLSGLLSSSFYPYFIGITLLWWPGQKLCLICGPWKHGESVYKDLIKVETLGMGENANESSENFFPWRRIRYNDNNHSPLSQKSFPLCWVSLILLFQFILLLSCNKSRCWIFRLLLAAAAKSLQSCLTLCDPIDSSPLGSPVPGILQARTLEWVAISFSNAWKWKVKVKLLSHVRLLVTPWTAAYQAPPTMGFSRQEYWSGVPLPSLTYCLGVFISGKELRDYLHCCSPSTDKETASAR